MKYIKNISIFVGVFFALLIVFFLTMDRSIGVYDEGLILTGALRVYYGEYPHYDFYANYGPAQFYIIGYLYKLFGPMLIIERLFDLATKALIVIVSYLTISKFFSLKSSVAAAFVVFLCLIGIRFYGYPIYQTFLLILIGLMLIVRRGLDQNGIYVYLYSGLLIGTAALFRYDVGFFAYVALVVSLFVFSLIHRQWFRGFLFPISKRLILFSIGSATPVGLVLVSHFFEGAFGDFFHDVIKFPAQNYAATRSLPFPRLSFGSFPIYLPVIIVCISIAFLLSVLFKEQVRKISLGQIFIVISLIFLVVFLFLKGVVRVSVIHMLLGILPAILLSFCIYDIFAKRSDLWRISGIFIAVISLISALAVAARPIAAAITQENYLNSSKAISYFDQRRANFERDWIDSEKSSERLFLHDYNRTETLNYLSRKTRVGDYFYSGLNHHDKVFVNDNSVYFLLNLRPATKWHHFDPGLQNNKFIQAEIITDLMRNKPKYILLDSSWDNVNEPNESAKSSGVFDLDHFISQNYGLDRCFGNICIYSLNNQS